ncbi:SRPBCC family protein [Chitinophaga filiformis]|uniref:Uncharacterized conserved protein YndB, AHSA1/START domain n=1 Tax=Chitinophaga filiformis TaxID=104663 RepID=A0A1G7NI81_CHIFI|nr:SRPBCC domain-containing protein [Chitinophaga filiformis]SDF73788.1 Uncharacterized conserved protein YndB, AHSA1/START domain [Chitinophaga filiformis]
MKRDIKLKWFYPHPVETIWECLTNPDILKQWNLASSGFRAEVGFKWMEVTKPRPKMDWDGKMYFEVLEVVPLQKLSYSFKGGPGEGVYNLDTVVNWILVPKDGGTELHLEQIGFKGMKNYISSFIMEMGWKNKVAKRFQQALTNFTDDSATVR